MRRSGWVVLIVAGLAALLLGGRAVTGLFVDRGWFAGLNAEPVFWEQTFDSFALRGSLWLIGSLFAFANLVLAGRRFAIPNTRGAS